MNEVTHKNIGLDSGKSIASRLPDFMIIGAAKSGTTTLYLYLQRHPEIFLPELKEPEFFSNETVYSRGLKWYTSLFSEATSQQICGEASTRYTRWPHTLDAARNIAEAISECKFIYVMRHPVERAYSHYVHYMRDGVTMTFEEALETTDILDTSMYMKQIERFLRFFPRKSFLFLLFEDLISEPVKSVKQVQKFLDISEMNLTDDGQILGNVGRADFYIRQRTTQRFRAIPGLSPIIDRIPQAWRDVIHRQIKRSPLGKRLAKDYQTQLALNPETRTRLVKRFERPNRELEEFLDRDLSHWNT